ncbi:MAG: hypothetical protein RLO50_11685 [Azospirillaceae bacterium]
MRGAAISSAGRGSTRTIGRHAGVHAAILAVTLLSGTGVASAQTPPDEVPLPGYFAVPLDFAAASHVSLDNAWVDYLGSIADPAACDGDPGYRLRLEGLGLVAAYYGLAEHLFLGGAPSEDGWGYAVYDDWYAFDEGRDWTTAGDLLKAVPADLREVWIDQAVDAVPIADRRRLLAAVEAYLAAYGPIATFVANDPARADDLVGDLYAGRVPLSLAGTGLPDVGDGCDHAQAYLHLGIGRDETYVAVPSVSTVVRTFWLRRHAEGNQRLVHDLLAHAHDALTAAIPVKD